ncbi:MAG: DUF4832 domain-containing protein [Clostridia bacterium]|nr:DUF4832 domain-containing protein [Clostridia bacterium]
MARIPKPRILVRKMKAKLQPARRAASHAGRRMRTGTRRSMTNMGVGRTRSLLVLPLLIVLIVAAAQMRLPRVETVRFLPAEGIVRSPMAGVAVSAREDIAAAPEETALVWAKATWRELEPEEGEYAFDEFDEAIHLDEWRRRGAKLVLRLSLDSPGSGYVCDLPDWLRERVDGEAYSSGGEARFAPDYADPALQDKHFLLLQAIARRYADDIAYVEIGSLGSDGAWTAAEGAPPLPMTDVTGVYIWQYCTAFEGQIVLAAGPYHEAVLQNAGAYLADMGDGERAWEWVNRYRFGGWDEQIGALLRPEPEYGLKAPAGAWLGSADGADAIERLAQEARATYICVEQSALSPEMRAAVERIAQKIGYRFWIRQAQWPEKVRPDYSLYVDICVENDGIAPAPVDMPLCLALLDAEGNVACSERTEVSAAEWRPGTSDVRVRITVPYDMKKGEYTLAAALCDTQALEPAVRFAMECETVGLWHVLGSVKVY